MLHKLSIRNTLGAFAASSVVLLAGCASDLGAGDYSRNSVGQISRSDSGIIVSSRPIHIEGTKSGVGALSGAAAGGLAGGELGANGRTSTAGVIVGALLGGLVGAAIEEGVTERDGFAYTIELERDGEYITITQAGNYPIANGTPVWVEYGERARVIPKSSNAGYSNQRY